MFFFFSKLLFLLSYSNIGDSFWACLIVGMKFVLSVGSLVNGLSALVPADSTILCGIGDVGVKEGAVFAFRGTKLRNPAVTENFCCAVDAALPSAC